MSKLTKQFLKQPLIAKYFDTEEEVLDAMMQTSRQNAFIIGFNGGFFHPYLTRESRPAQGKSCFGPELYVPLTAGNKIKEAIINILEAQLAEIKGE